jgi:hypothetical protein
MNPKSDRVTAGDADQNDKEASRDQNQKDEPDSAEDNYQRDESNRGERPDNLRRRSEWFQKRSGGT